MSERLHPKYHRARGRGEDFPTRVSPLIRFKGFVNCSYAKLPLISEAGRFRDDDDDAKRRWIPPRGGEGGETSSAFLYLYRGIQRQRRRVSPRCEATPSGRLNVLGKKIKMSCVRMHRGELEEFSLEERHLSFLPLFLPWLFFLSVDRGSLRVCGKLRGMNVECFFS